MTEKSLTDKGHKAVLIGYWMEKARRTWKQPGANTIQEGTPLP